MSALEVLGNVLSYSKRGKRICTGEFSVSMQEAARHLSCILDHSVKTALVILS
jgi:hypothetical protein